jgi:hypothetical protein
MLRMLVNTHITSPGLTWMKEWMFLKGCTLETALVEKNQGYTDNLEGQEAKLQGHDEVLPALFRETAGPYHRDYDTSAHYESLRPVKDPRGPADMTATRKSGLRCHYPPLGGLTE